MNIPKILCTVGIVPFAAFGNGCLLGAQSDNDRVKDLVSILGSSSIEVREEASRRLKNEGRNVIPALLKFANDSDKETALRVEYLIKAIEVRERLSVSLLKALPEVDDRISNERSLASELQKGWLVEVTPDKIAGRMGEI